MMMPSAIALCLENMTYTDSMILDQIPRKSSDSRTRYHSYKGDDKARSYTLL